MPVHSEAPALHPRPRSTAGADRAMPLPFLVRFPRSLQSSTPASILAGLWAQTSPACAAPALWALEGGALRLDRTGSEGWGGVGVTWGGPPSATAPPPLLLLSQVLEAGAGPSGMLPPPRLEVLKV